ncbi:ABC transporter permease [Paenibacillus tarimensis]
MELQTGKAQARLPFLSFPAAWFVRIGFVMIFLFFAVPMLRLIWLSFSSEYGVDLKGYQTLLTSPRTWSVLENTVYVVCGSTFIAVLLGVSLAWLVAYSDIRGKRVVQAFALVPFLIPSYIVTLAWAQFFAPKSMFSTLLHTIFATPPWNVYSLGGMIFVMGLSHYPVVYLLTIGVLRRIPRDLEMASRLSGAGRVRTFIKITWPMALPGIASGGLLAFLAGLDNFGIPAFLGIPANISVLSTYIYEQIVGFGPAAFTRAAVLSVLLGGIALFGTLLQWLLTRKAKTFETSGEDRQPRYFLGRYRWLAEIIVWFFLICTSLVPLLSMLTASLIKAYGLAFKPGNLTFRHYQFILLESEKVKHALSNSVLLGIMTMVVCLVLGTVIAYYRVRKPSRWSKWSELMIGMPYALPGIVLALAMILVWMEPLPGWNPGIYGSIAILFIAYIVRFLILQVRGSATSLMQVDLSMEEAAHINGAGKLSSWKFILFPLILPGLTSGAFMVLLHALTELTVSSILWSSGSETIGVVIFGFEQAGYTTYSTSLSTLIVMFIGAGMLAFLAVQNMTLRNRVNKNGYRTDRHQ